MKNIYILIGASGSGKTAIQNILCSKYNLKPVVSYTTRAPRYEGENNHIFINEEEFYALKNKAAQTCYDDNLYCATEEQVNEADLYTLNPDGLTSFRQQYHGDKKHKVIYIDSPFVTRMERMENRGDNFDNVLKRIKKDAIEFRGVENIADIIVYNGDDTKVESVVNLIWDFIEECECDNT